MNKPTKRTKANKRGCESLPEHPIHHSARLPLSAAASGTSTRDYVYQCITAAAPDGAQFDDDSVLSSIPISRPDDLGVCLNYHIPLIGNNAWGAGDIKGAWTVDMLTAKTDYRRNH